MKTTLEMWQKAMAAKNPPGMQRFLAHGEKLIDCLVSSQQADLPALAFYQTKARQWLFYLQALCRVYKQVGDKKRFKMMGGSLKELEDQLGRIDFWDGWLKQTSALAQFPAAMTTALQQHMDEEVQVLARLLDEGKWWASEHSAVQAMLEELQAEDWHKASKDRKKVVEFLADEIKEIDQAVRTDSYDFTQLESGVHEFRRQLRWISIYAHALNGLLQLRAVATPAALYDGYLTDTVLNSPFNQLPLVVEGVEPVYVQAPNFYALSWLIAQIGQIKDEGQKIEALLDVAKQTGLSEDAHWLACAQTILPAKETSAAQITAIVREFVIDHGILQRWQEDFAASE